MLGILIMLNNYFHDVASALLLCCAVLMLALLKKAEKSNNNEEVKAFLVEIYGKISWLAAISLAWILLGGMVRALAYRAYEWSDAVGRGQVPALIIKHVLFFMLVGAGIKYWVKLRGMMTKLRTMSEIDKKAVE